jgi:hypothetical protein
MRSNPAVPPELQSSRFAQLRSGCPHTVTYVFESLRIMKTINSHWHDAKNNRRVAYSVAFAKNGETVEIKAVTPTQVTFVCPESKSDLRTVGVWTQKGRELLAHQLRTSGHLTELQREIEVSLAV